MTLLITAIAVYVAVSSIVIWGASYFNSNIRAQLSDLALARRSIKQILEDYALRHIEYYRRTWMELVSNDNNSIAQIAKLHLEAIENARIRIRGRAIPEAVAFLEEVMHAQYLEELENLDRKLFERERHFVQLLNATRTEISNLLALEQARARVEDIEYALNDIAFAQAMSFIDELSGNVGILTAPIKKVVKNNFLVELAQMRTRIMRRSFERCRRNIRISIFIALTRYVYHFIRSNVFYVLFTVGLISFGIEAIIKAYDLQILGWAGGLLLAGASTIKVYEKLARSRWREARRQAVQRAAIQLYLLLSDFLIARTPIDVAHQRKDSVVSAAASSESEAV